MYYSFIPLVCFYVLFGEWLALDVDPCAATSGSNLSMVLVFWASFPFISGLIFHKCLETSSFNSKAKCALLLFFPSLCLWATQQATFMFFSAIEEYLEKLPIWSWFFEVKCYNETEPKILGVAVVMGIIFYFLMVAGLFCISRIKQRLFF